MTRAVSVGTVNFEPGSYRDRDGRVFYDRGGGICRVLSDRALSEWEAVSRTQFFQTAMREGRVVHSERVEPVAENGQSAIPGWAGVLAHARIPFVSYPYEWTFGMLKDAALLHLELLDAALVEDISLKDGTAYNIQWLGPRPVFIDVASFERLSPGQPWAGYRQFCQTFLFPLLLQAYRNVPFHPWLRGRLDGISPRECRNLMSLRDVFRRGVPAHVLLHAWLDGRHATKPIDVAQALPAAGFGKELIRRNVASLARLIRGLHWNPPESTWSNYAEANSYAAADRRHKEEFVREVVQSQRWKLVWDLGCNTGNYSRIAAEYADGVVAFDADHLAVERLYRSLKGDSGSRAAKILPLVTSVVDAAGGQGWRSAERKGIVDRGRPDLTLCLALVHHLVIGCGVPMPELIEWLAELKTNLVIEFVSKDDPMVRRLLNGRRDNYSDYEAGFFERLLQKHFQVVRSKTLESRTRTLYYAVAIPRS